MEKTYLFCVFLSMLLTLVWACEQGTPDVEVAEESRDVLADEKDRPAITFARALAGAMQRSEALRAFLKEEALLMFDNDYDILYHAIKGEQLSDGNTPASLLMEECGAYSQELPALWDRVPGLTIFVPSLSSIIFSAESWDTSVQVPMVAVLLHCGDKVYYVDGKGEENVVEAQMVPAFPVVVIKENERVVTGDDIYAVTDRAKGKTAMRGGVNYRFLDEVFDGSRDRQGSIIAARQETEPDRKLEEAYEIYENTNGWHRDYIYYGITPDITEGEFSYDYQEHITSFAMKGGDAAVSRISDQDGDPGLRIKLRLSERSWMDGFFEFKVRVLLNAKNGIGAEYVTYFSAMPDDLFRMSYKHRCGSGAVLRLFYCPTLEEILEYRVELPLFQWDLNQYASAIKIEIEEVDLAVTTTITDTRTVKFANNFDIQGDVLKKVGLKFGAKLETTESQSIKKSFTQENDDLGGVIINFADNVLLGKDGENWKTREYETGWFKIGVAPRKVQ
ncbi:hypothetical protein [Sinomicrobium soli]|uniref:hypothetical protein n=1 Tax=Sinomicrobium sp. N-1-3-6 TaxID=2219864 RepID=UPI000DCBA4ED|nr:hypothetical protein [Sinomicrobium sp. N-1-3-6]RAV29890.1 hypothetical protein DN748_07265 [Sinomicrobium sp. N-1-3-6]